MKKVASLLLTILLAGAGWLFSEKYDLEGLDQITLRPQASDRGRTGTDELPVARAGDSIRIASFNIQVFGQTKLGKPHVMEILAETVRRFDIVAIQEIRSRDQSLMPKFVEMINSTGRQYDFVIGELQGRTHSTEQYAYVYDLASIEIDRESVYSIEDPHDLLHRPPLVAGFRVRGPPADQAFTFTLINMHTDPDEAKEEVNVLADVFRAVRNDGRGEDDIILLGDLNVDDRNLGALGEVPGIMWLISGVPTNTRGTKLYDNILLHQQATAEFTGRAGVFDLMREFNLTMEQALEVSDHFPVWGEFSIYEAGRAGPVAARPELAR